LTATTAASAAVAVDRRQPHTLDIKERGLAAHRDAGKRTCGHLLQLTVCWPWLWMPDHFVPFEHGRACTRYRRDLEVMSVIA
jgi:hypothetical protein